MARIVIIVARGPLCDTFGCQCVRSNMLICDELLCEGVVTFQVRESVRTRVHGT